MAETVDATIDEEVEALKSDFMDVDVVVEKVDAFLQTRQTTLWGQAFDVYEDDRRRAAAKWFTKELANFLEYLDETDDGL